MTGLWPAWLGALALAGVALAHWLVLHRLMAVSGRFTALVDALRGKAPAEIATPSDELEAALLAATLAEFGADAVARVAATTTPSAPPRATLPPQSLSTHVLFFAGLVLGGLVAALLTHGFAITAEIRSAAFEQLFTLPVVRIGVLFGGGLLVGAGTRMATGCTSGHGLCGVSRFQPGSLLATCSFFGAGIVTSLALDALLGGAG